MSTPSGVSGAYLPPGEGSRQPRLARTGNLALFALAVIGGLLGAAVFWFHLTTDPLVDVHAYYDAAVRLNAGQPLYPLDGDPSRPTFYFYPPLLATVMQPFAGLPFHVFAIGWTVIVFASFVALVRRLGARRRTFIALGLLGIPIGWALAVAQAHVPMTLLMAIGQPWSIALAANIKLFPILIALWWIGRRDAGAVAALVAWLVLFAGAQWLLEPAGSAAFFSAIGLDQTIGIRNFSPFAVSPVFWVVLMAIGGVATLILAPTRWGWPAAIILATLASPRLLVYMLVGLLAAVRESEPPRGEEGFDAEPRDAVERRTRFAR